MNSSSTQVPFMIAGFIAVLIHSFISDSTLDNKVNATNKVETTTAVAMLEKAHNKQIQKLAAR